MSGSEPVDEEGRADVIPGSGRCMGKETKALVRHIQGIACGRKPAWRRIRAGDSEG